MTHKHAWLKFALAGRAPDIEAYFIAHAINITLKILIYN
jgi:hypothetical protein